MRGAINLIWKLSVLAELGVALRLILQGLGGEYPALAAACCILPIKSVLLMSSFFSRIPAEQMRYTSMELQPVEWIVSGWVVYELFSRWTRCYRGIGRFGKLLMVFLLVSALLISMAFWPTEWEALVFAYNFRIVYVLNRVIWVTLAVFVVGTWLFFRNYPVSIAPNVIRHTYVSVVYFSVVALSEWVFTLKGLKGLAFVGWINLSIVTVSMGCYCAWAFLLTRQGQTVTQMQAVSVEDAQRIERINHELLVFMGDFPKNGR
jgi:hypothetical protein